MKIAIILVNIIAIFILIEKGYVLSENREGSLILPFSGEKFKVELPEGYTIVDGNQTPALLFS